MIDVAIIGATGYTGEELIRLLIAHPNVNLKYLTSRSEIGTKVQAYYPHFQGIIDQEFTEFVPEQTLAGVDLVFLCLPHGVSMDIAKVARKFDTKVIDLGADFRIKDQEVFETYYGVSQTAPDLLAEAVYGLTELNGQDIKHANIIANPGCFVTCSLLSLLPIISADYIDHSSIIIDAKTGVSGAGRGAKVSNLLAELANNVYAYNPTAHRHIPEIEQCLNLQTDQSVTVQFTPHLLPTERGILTTIYLDLTKNIEETEIREIYENFYQNAYFVHILDDGIMPQIKAVRASNFAHIQVKVDKRTNRLIIFSVIDNLVKGAAGQAVQNMNLMFAFKETLGLTQIPVYP